MSRVVVATRPMLNPRFSARLAGDFAGIHVDLVKRGFRGLTRLEPALLRWGGHPAVTSSLAKGAKLAALPIDVDPWILGSATDIGAVGVLAGRKTLEWAVGSDWSKDIPISVGPNVFVRPREARRTLSSLRVSQVIVPSPWVAEFYVDDLPEIFGRCVVWTAGVDHVYWCPAQTRSSTLPLAILYVKHAPRSIEIEVLKLLKRNGWRSHVMRYGRYRRSEYRRALDAASLNIVVGGIESQGLFMFESWSMNVPTLVYSGHECDPHMVLPSLSAESRLQTNSPYLGQETGAFWSCADELDSKLAQLQLDSFSPRSWVERHATLEKSARKYLDLVSLHSR